jgi:Flp pilus assembly protein TadD
LAALLVACAQARPAPSQPQPEQQREVAPQPWVNQRAYRHVLDAMLARQREDHAGAVTSLRDALLYDPDSAYLRTLLGEELARLGRLPEAEEQLHAVLERDPRYAPARVLAGRIAFARGQIPEARTQLRAAAQDAPDDADAQMELVRLEIGQGDLAAAATAARAFGLAAERAADELKRAPDDAEGDAAGARRWSAERLRERAAEAWLAVGRAQADKQDDAGAEESFARAVALDPSADDTLLARAAFLESRRRFAEARELHLKLLSRRPEAPEVLSALARLSIADGDLEVAGAHEKKLLALAGSGAASGEDEKRELAGALFRVAVPLLGVRRGGDALAALDGALRLFPDHPELFFYRGLALDQRGQHKEAAQIFEKLEAALTKPGKSRDAALASVAQGPAFLAPEPVQLLLDVRVQAALARGRAGEVPESARRMKLLFAEQPQDEGVALGLFEALERAGHSREAVALLEGAEHVRPGNPALLYALGTALDRAGRVPDALKTMRQVLAAAPAHAGALNYVGYTMVEEGGDLKEAEGLLRRAMELRPDDGAIADSLGFCLLKQGLLDRALAELRRADRLVPGDPVILGHLGDALLQAGKRDEAAASYRRALGRLDAPRKAAVGPDDLEPRDPEPGDARVRAELVEKLRALTAR